MARLVKNAQVPIPPPTPAIRPRITAELDQCTSLEKRATVAISNAAIWLRKLTSRGVIRREPSPPKKSEAP